MSIEYYNKLSELPHKVKRLNISVILEDGTFAEIGLQALKELINSKPSHNYQPPKK